MILIQFFDTRLCDITQRWDLYCKGQSQPRMWQCELSGTGLTPQRCRPIGSAGGSWSTTAGRLLIKLTGIGPPVS